MTSEQLMRYTQTQQTEDNTDINKTRNVDLMTTDMMLIADLQLSHRCNTRELEMLSQLKI